MQTSPQPPDDMLSTNNIYSVYCDREHINHPDPFALLRTAIYTDRKHVHVYLQKFVYETVAKLTISHYCTTFAVCSVQEPHFLSVIFLISQSCMIINFYNGIFFKESNFHCYMINQLFANIKQS